jgi:hypothetical protein
MLSFQHRRLPDLARWERFWYVHPLQRLSYTTGASYSFLPLEAVLADTRREADANILR